MTNRFRFSEFCDLLDVPHDKRDPSKLYTDLKMDSLTVMDFVMLIEDRLDIDIPDKAQTNLRTIGDLYETACKIAGIAPEYDITVTSTS